MSLHIQHLRTTENSASVFLSIVVPLYNEEESVGALIDSISRVGERFDFNYEVILIDDGSSDSTWDRIVAEKNRCTRIKGIKFRRNYGQTAAMVAGFDHAKGQIILTMDGDLQNDPSDIPKLLQYMEKEDCDIVSGWRKDRKDHFSRVLPSKVANAIISSTTGVYLHDYGCSLKAYRADIIRSIHAYGEMHRFFPALASMTGAKVKELAVTHHNRQFGESKYGFSRIFKVLSDIFAMNLIIRFSSTPLLGFALFALPFFLLTIGFGGISLLAFVQNWTAGKSIFFMFTAGLTGMTVVQLVCLGILAELAVGTSDLSHTEMPEISKRSIEIHTHGTR